MNRDQIKQGWRPLSVGLPESPRSPPRPIAPALQTRGLAQASYRSPGTTASAGTPAPPPGPAPVSGAGQATGSAQTGSGSGPATVSGTAQGTGSGQVTGSGTGQTAGRVSWPGSGPATRTQAMTALEPVFAKAASLGARLAPRPGAAVLPQTSTVGPEAAGRAVERKLLGDEPQLFGKTMAQIAEYWYLKGRLAADRPSVTAPTVQPQRVLPLAESIPQALARLGVAPAPAVVGPAAAGPAAAGPAAAGPAVAGPAVAGPAVAGPAVVAVPAVAAVTGPAVAPGREPLKPWSSAPTAGPPLPQSTAPTSLTTAAATPVPTAAPPAPAAGPTAPEARAPLSPTELHSALLYWLDLLTDECRAQCLEMARAIANDLNIKLAVWAAQGLLLRPPNPFPQLPNTMDEFRAGIDRIPSAQLEDYLIGYRVVPPKLALSQPLQLGDREVLSGSLLEQLQRLEAVGSIDQFEKYDQDTKLQRPPTAPSNP